MNKFLRVSPWLLSLALAACGGGGGNGSDPAPAANADLPVSVALTIQRNTDNGEVKAVQAGVDCGTECNGTVTTGSQVTLVATPADGYRFVGWNAPSGCTDTNNCTVDVKDATNVSATFSPLAATATYGLNVNIAGPANGGAVAVEPAAINCTTGTCHADIASGATATLVAAPAAGYTFTGWSVSGLSCTGTTCAVPMTADRTVTATFAPIEPPKYVLYAAIGTGTGRVATTFNAISCPGDCNDTWPQGTKFTLVATPAAGFVFGSWSGGGCTGSTPSCNLILNATTRVTANFVPAFAPANVSLTTALVGQGRITAAGIDCGSDCTESVAPGTRVDLVATPAAGQRFVGWTGACSGTVATCSLTLSANTNAVAQFAAITHTVSVAKVGSGTVSGTGINCGADCNETYPAGSAVVLTATPASGYTFDGWTGACTGKSTCALTVNAAASVSARFVAAASPWLPLFVSLEGNGLVTSARGSINCGTTCTSYSLTGTAVVLTATPATGYAFAGWTGACTHTNPVCNLTVTGATYARARFTPVVTAPVMQALTITRSGSGTVNAASGAIACGSTCSASLANGTDVVLSATPQTGFTFAGWGGACTGTQSCAVKMNAAITVNALFSPVVVVPTDVALTLNRTGSGTITSAPAGINCGSSCTASFAAGSVLTLQATPATGYTFTGWSGAGCSGTSSCTVTLSAASSVSAAFAPVAVTGTQYVPLTLASGPASDKTALRTGVPFPIGAITDITKLRLETGDGAQEVPAQFDAISRWPDGSIKVALTHLVTDLGAAKTYRVAYGSNVARAALPRNVLISGTGSTEIVVDTGAARFAVNNKGILAKLWR
ncbi:MAG: hypothetical protein RLZZ618_3087, partial [Pseudomonadota bacterium]